MKLTTNPENTNTTSSGNTTTTPTSSGDTPTNTPAEQSYFQQHKLAIILGTTFGVVGLILLIVGIYFLVKKMKAPQELNATVVPESM